MTDWIHHRIPLHDDQVIEKLSQKSCKNRGLRRRRISRTGFNSFRPSFFRGTFILNSTLLDNEITFGEDALADTFLSLKGWKKGFVWINGFNLGRFWPETGPQQTLYVPKYRLLPQGQVNHILILELESSPCLSRETQDEKSLSCSVEFVTDHVINASVPDT